MYISRSVSFHMKIEKIEKLQFCFGFFLQLITTFALCKSFILCTLYKINLVRDRNYVKEQYCTFINGLEANIREKFE